MKPECLSPEELEKLKEAVDERKKLILSLRGKPWPMKKKLVTLRYFNLLLENNKKTERPNFNFHLPFKVSSGDILTEYVPSCRESQEFVEKYEGALGKGKGRKLYAYKVMMTKASTQ